MNPNLELWLSSALTDLDAQVQARLEAEYTAHFRDALATTGDEAQALAELGNPSELNRRLQRTYLTTEEAKWIDHPVNLRRSWFYLGMLLCFGVALLSGYRWPELQVMGVAVFLASVSREVFFHFMPERRAAFFSYIAGIFVVLTAINGLFNHEGASFMYFAPVGILVWDFISHRRLNTWRKVLNHG